METTFEQITRLANERHMLYRAVSHQPLTPSHRDRIHSINNQLPVLWDQYRRELATDTRLREVRQQRDNRERHEQRIRDHDLAA